MKRFGASFFLLIIIMVCFSCKMKTDDVLPEVPKKQNRLEKTQWKTSGSSGAEPDILLDFFTHVDVQEYITLKTGKNIKSRTGTYKLSSDGYLKIKWGKLKSDQADGCLREKELVVNELLKTTKYYKVKDY